MRILVPVAALTLLLSPSMSSGDDSLRQRGDAVRDLDRDGITIGFSNKTKLLASSFFIGEIALSVKESESLARFTETESLALVGTTVSPKGLEFLRSMTSLKELTLHKCKGSTRETHEHIRWLTALASLSVTDCGFDDHSMENVASLHMLQRLTMSGTQVTGVGIKRLGNLTKLRSVKLVGSSVDSLALQSLKRSVELSELAVEVPSRILMDLTFVTSFPRLKELGLVGCRVDNTELSKLQAVPQLQLLELASAGLTDVAALPALAELETLRLRDNPFAGSSLDSIGKLPKLAVLDLTDTQIGDKGVASLAKVASLEVLFLNRCRVSDECVSSLTRLKKLHRLFIGGTGITPRGVVEISKGLPSTQVFGIGLERLDPKKP